MRCHWVTNDPLYIQYHDQEWGVPLFDDRKLFELLVLEGFQAGLSWLTVLKKRSAYRELFDGFDPARMASYDEKKVEELLSDPRIIRNRLKVLASIKNAQAVLKIQEREGSFSKFIWSFVDGRPIIHHFKDPAEVPARTELSDHMSKVLKREGFSFVGSTICYSFMQAAGLVMDHTTNCFRYQELSQPRNIP